MRYAGSPACSSRRITWRAFLMPCRDSGSPPARCRAASASLMQRAIARGLRAQTAAVGFLPTAGARADSPRVYRDEVKDPGLAPVEAYRKRLSVRPDPVQPAILHAACSAPRGGPTRCSSGTGCGLIRLAAAVTNRQSSWPPPRTPATPTSTTTPVPRERSSTRCKPSTNRLRPPDRFFIRVLLTRPSWQSAGSDALATDPCKSSAAYSSSDRSRMKETSNIGSSSAS